MDATKPSPDSHSSGRSVATPSPYPSGRQANGLRRAAWRKSPVGGRAAAFRCARGGARPTSRPRPRRTGWARRRQHDRELLERQRLGLEDRLEEGRVDERELGGIAAAMTTMRHAGSCRGPAEGALAARSGPRARGRAGGTRAPRRPSSARASRGRSASAWTASVTPPMSSPTQSACCQRPRGEDRLGRRARRAAHRVRLGRLDAQGEARQAVGHEVDPQDVTGRSGIGSPRNGARNMTQISPELLVSR